MLTLGIRSCRCWSACWRGRSTRPTLEHREAVVGRCPRRRKVCESVGERRCDVAGSLVAFLGCTDACTQLGWVVGSTDFPASRNGVGTVPGGESVGERWRDGAGRVPTLCVSSHTDACSHLGAGGGRGRFFHREMVLGLCRWPRTVCESVGERWRDGAGRVPTLGLLMSM